MIEINELIEKAIKLKISIQKDTEFPKITVPIYIVVLILMLSLLLLILQLSSVSLSSQDTMNTAFIIFGICSVNLGFTYFFFVVIETIFQHLMRPNIRAIIFSVLNSIIQFQKGKDQIYKNQEFDTYDQIKNICSEIDYICSLNKKLIQIIPYFSSHKLYPKIILLMQESVQYIQHEIVALKGNLKEKIEIQLQELRNANSQVGSMKYNMIYQELEMRLDRQIEQFQILREQLI